MRCRYEKAIISSVFGCLDFRFAVIRTLLPIFSTNFLHEKHYSG